jgi:DNA-binding transcriptional ArsR family regulator
MSNHSGIKSRGSSGESNFAGMGDWTFLSNHATALLCVARDPDIRLREIADCVGVTERAAQRLVSDLRQAGYVSRERVGRRNRYRVNRDLPMRHPMVAHHGVAELLDALAPIEPRGADAA